MANVSPVIKPINENLILMSHYFKSVCLYTNVTNVCYLLDLTHSAHPFSHSCNKVNIKTVECFTQESWKCWDSPTHTCDRVIKSSLISLWWIVLVPFAEFPFEARVSVDFLELPEAYVVGDVHKTKQSIPPCWKTFCLWSFGQNHKWIWPRTGSLSFGEPKAVTRFTRRKTPTHPPTPRHTHVSHHINTCIFCLSRLRSEIKRKIYQSFFACRVFKGPNLQAHFVIVVANSESWAWCFRLEG